MQSTDERNKEQDHTGESNIRSAGTSIRGLAAYGGLLLGAIAFFFLIQGYGESLVAPAAAASAAGSGPAASSSSDVLFHLLVAMAVVVLAGRLLGRLFTFIHQPQVIGEVIGGILLGPSLLGLISPEGYAYLLPPSIAPFLGMVAQLGVILYMFLVGLELDPHQLRGQVKATIATSHVGIAFPFVLGSALSLYLYPRLSTSDVSFTNFALFLGVALSITAFPVLARILSDRGMIRTKLGAIALTCAAVGDVTAWCLLAFIVGVVQAKAESALLVAFLTLGFIAFMFVVVQPLAGRMARAWDRNPTEGGIALALVGVLIAALTTETIGVHAVFGAFLFGAVIPHDSALAHSLKNSIEHVVTILLLPAFFAFTGMRTEVGLLSTWYQWAICGLIIVVAVVGKFGGTMMAARVTGLNWRDAAGLGVLMNTRGLMELIVLNIGLDLGIISPTLFTMMVLMALATTLATTPALHLLVPQIARETRGDAFKARIHALARADVRLTPETPV
jgi:Kef-type K+ transport system membrane component KefB